MLTARTLAEAQVYVSVATAGDASTPATTPAPIVPGTNLTEGEDAWTYTSEAGEITVPFASENAARTTGVRFGLGVSELVDAAQWSLVASTYARRALAADLKFTGGSAEQRAEIEETWEAAAEAVVEAMKFLPDGANEVPAEGVWSDLGRQAVAQNPQLLTRAKLEDDLEHYQGTLEDFRTHHGSA